MPLLLSVAAKAKVQKMGVADQPLKLADRPPVNFCASVFLCWSRDNLKVGAIFEDQMSAKKAFDGKAIAFSGRATEHACIPRPETIYSFYSYKC